MLTCEESPKIERDDKSETPAELKWEERREHVIQALGESGGEWSLSDLYDYDEEEYNSIQGIVYKFFDTVGLSERARKELAMQVEEGAIDSMDVLVMSACKSAYEEAKCEQQDRIVPLGVSLSFFEEPVTADAGDIFAGTSLNFTVTKCGDGLLRIPDDLPYDGQDQ